MEAGWFILPKTVFLDRDGLINKCALPHQYISEWNEFIFLPGAVQSLKCLKEAGYQLILITNQRGIARGMITEKQVNELHDDMQKYLMKKKAQFDGIYMCPHEEGICKCRKPEIGLFLQAEKKFEIDKFNSWMVGDSDSDVEAGERYGIKTIKTTSMPVAVRIILEEDKKE